ncbi:MAG: MFS transporter [Thermomicrobia bacterium]|nr:MFS transporter [Thermomicrobia bacterium]
MAQGIGTPETTDPIRPEPQVVSQLGDGMFTTAIALAVLERTNSGTALSLTVIAQFLPFLLLGIVAGALVDRWERRRTMVVSDLMRGAVVLLIPLLDGLGVLHPSSYAVVAFLLTTAGLFFDPAKNALIPTLVSRASLARTNALLESTRQVLFVAGPAVGGVLIAVVGIDGVFIADGATFFLSALILSGVPHARPADALLPTEEVETGGERLGAAIRRGLDYIRTNRLLRLIVGVGSALNFFLSPLPILIPLFFTQVLHTGPSAFGAAISIVFVGFLIGAVLVGALAERIGKGWLTIVGVVLAGGATGLFGLRPPVIVVLGLALLGGVAIGALNVCESTVIQENAPDDMRGRVFAVYESISQGGRAIAVALSGVLADLIGVSPLFLTVGVLVLICGGALALSPTIRAAK